MMKTAMEMDIQFLPGVGPRRAALLRSELAVETVGDLVHLYPFRYIDRSTVQKIADLHPDQSYVQVIGTVRKVRLYAKNGAELPADKIKYNLVNRLSVMIADDTGEIEVVFFKGIKWMHARLIPGSMFLFFGKPQAFNGRINMVHPEFDAPDNAQAGILTGVYPSTEKLKTGHGQSDGETGLSGPGHRFSLADGPASGLHPQGKRTGADQLRPATDPLPDGPERPGESHLPAQVRRAVLPAALPP